MNILVATLSTMPPVLIERQYQVKVSGCSKTVITAKQTNESILRCVADLDAIRQSGGLGRVIVLVSHKVQTTEVGYIKQKTSLQYYEEVLKTYYADAQLETIPIEDDTEREFPIYSILDKLCSYISNDDKVYIDSAGGKRTIANVLQLLTKILQYKGIKNPCTLYADIQGNPPFIADTTEFVRMTNLAEAFNEFMTTGKAQQLEQCIPHQEQNACYAELLQQMCTFSDKIRIGDIEHLDQILSSLRSSLYICRSQKEPSSIETVVLRQFLDIIEQRLVTTDQNSTLSLQPNGDDSRP